MTNTWETNLKQAFDTAFGASARANVAVRVDTCTWDANGELTEHLDLANQVFETIALALHRGTASGAGAPSTPIP